MMVERLRRRCRSGSRGSCSVEGVWGLLAGWGKGWLKYVRNGEELLLLV
jgi:hypothetical protein